MVSKTCSLAGLEVYRLSTGDILMRKYKQAVADRNLQVEAHRGLTETTGEELTGKWEDMCVLWERTPYPKYKAVADPYEVKNGGTGKCTKLDG